MPKRGQGRVPPRCSEILELEISKRGQGKEKEFKGKGFKGATWGDGIVVGCATLSEDWGWKVVPCVGKVPSPCRKGVIRH